MHRTCCGATRQLVAQLWAKVRMGLCWPFHPTLGPSAGLALAQPPSEGPAAWQGEGILGFGILRSLVPISPPAARIALCTLMLLPFLLCKVLFPWFVRLEVALIWWLKAACGERDRANPCNVKHIFIFLYRSAGLHAKTYLAGLI